MKRFILIIIQVLAMIAPNLVLSQSSSPEIDTLYDDEGRKYPISDLRINLDDNYGTFRSVPASFSCTAGYFNVYFTFNSGFVGAGAVFSQRRALICEVLSNISGMVNPTFTASATKVNILVDDITTIVPGASTLSTLGVFSPFFAFPNSAQTSNPGIMDGLIYKTITTQQDPYQTINSSFFLSSGSAANFYHGMVCFNFAAFPNGFNFNMSVPASGIYDAYTIMLHEMTHGLGFTSFIGPSGTSIWGLSSNYYSRYDRFLKAPNGTNLLSTNACSSQYGLAFTNNTLVLSPACSNPTNFAVNNTACNNAVYYSSPSLTHMPVFTPDCFISGSSLSHFEDQCYPPNSPYGNDLYFTMSNAIGPGVNKRYLKEEERMVLCDIGYSVISTFTSNAFGAAHNYTLGNCNNMNVFGVNDGVTPPPFQTYTINTNVLTPVAVNNILANDLNAVSFKCLQTVIGNGNLSNTTGTAGFTYTPTSSGVHVLSYIPVSASNIEGNITYIFVNITTPTHVCASPASGGCNLVYNGDFEQFSVLSTAYSNTVITCGWYPSSLSADYYNSLASTSSPFGIPCNFAGYEFDNVPGNGAYVGMLSWGNNSSFFSESIWSQLTNSLTPNTVYNLSFDVSLAEGYSNLPATIQAYLAPTTGFINSSGTNGINTVPGSILVTAQSSCTQTTGWTHYSMTFTTGATAGQKYICLGNLFGVFGNTITTSPPYLNGCLYQVPLMFGVQNYNFLDNVRLTPASISPTLTIPPAICISQTLNLTPYALPPGGTFSGPGVTCSGTNCIFNPSVAGIGSQIINYSVSVPSATCPYIGAASINVLNVFTVSPSISNPNCVFSGQTATLNASTNQNAPITCTWTPGNLTSNLVTTTPTASTIYTVMVSNGGCTNSATLQVNVLPAPSFTNLPVNFCGGAHYSYLENLLATGSPTGGVWLAPGLSITSSGPNSSQLNIPQTTSAGIYTVTYVYTAAPGCTIATQFTINVMPTPTLTGTGAYTVCANLSGSVTLTSSCSPSNGISYSWSPGGASTSSLTASPSVNTIYTLSASNGSCATSLSVQVTARVDCCGPAYTGEPVSYVSSATLSSTNLSGITAINQNITITGSVGITGEIRIAPWVQIFVSPGATLTSSSKNPVHIYACNNMWQGIYVLNGGKVKFRPGDLIEHAVNAIQSYNSTNTSAYPSYGSNVANYDIELDNVVFNRNYRAVSISNYTQTATTPPFAIRGCVFTCRDFSLAPGAASWPNALPNSAASLMNTVTPTNQTGSPYALLNYNPVSLKAPFSGAFDTYGALIENSGVTLNPIVMVPSYFGISVGEPAYGNLFDNLYTGILTRNSNVSSISNIFQNTRMAAANLPGSGIWAINDDSYPQNYNTSLSLVATFSPNVYYNRFYDCHTAVKAKKIYDLNIKFAEIRSTQSSLVTSNPNNTGYYGIYVTGNKFKAHIIENCKFLNLNTGIYFNSDAGPLYVPAFPAYGMLWDKVSIANNYFSSAAAPAAAIGNGYQYMGINASNNINSAAATYTLSGFGLRVQYNTFDRVWNGAWLTNFNNNLVKLTTSNNYVSLNQPTGASAGMQQFGIANRYNNNNVINTNTVTSYTTSISYPMSGIYSAQSTSTALLCNSVTTLPRGFEFASNNAATFWRSNSMNFNSRGMQLTGYGDIGQQGGATSPMDNEWVGSWTGRNGTWTDATSWAVNSPLFRRLLGTFISPNNNGQAASQSYANANIYNASSNVIFNCVTNANTTFTGIIPHRDLIDEAGDTLPPQTDGDEIAEFLLYWKLDIDSALLASNDTLRGFYDDNFPQDYGNLAEMEKLLGEGNFNDASSKISAFSPKTNIQSNYKQFYQLYYNYKMQGDSLNSADSSALALLASQCPYTDGPPVFKARALYDRLTGRLNDYLDEDCAGSGYSRPGPAEQASSNYMPFEQALQSAESKSLKRKVKADYQLYPNPASDQLYIRSNKASENLTAIICDISGRQVMTQNLRVSNYQAGMKLALKDGIYFVTLVNDKGEKLVKKLIISE